jgi:hypothetical protein
MRSGANGKSSHRPRWAGSVIAVGAGAMAALAIAYGLRSQISQPRVASRAEPELSAVASIAGGVGPTTIIVSTPNSNDCQRYQLNVDTGARNELGAISCSGDGSKQPGRLEAISKAFRNR